MIEAHRKESALRQQGTNRFAQKLADYSIALRRGPSEILQVNVGKLCNLTCVHCHVNAGPKRKEIMSRETIDRIIGWFGKTEIPTIDLTGGAPEMIPDFRYFIEQVKSLQPTRHVIDRCNLTILLERSYEDLAPFLARNKVEIIASMPCYSPENVNAQRGEGVFEGSIAALQLLNSLGYGTDANLLLHLVYNPVGAFLPPSQAELETDYKRELQKHFGIVFNNLYTLTNLPIGRFASYLRHNNKLNEYMELLIQAFNPATVDGLMCRNTISVGWRGEVYDCDFNQQLGMQWNDGGSKPLFLWDIDPEKIYGREIMTGTHCFGCTAGAGSSCGGAIV
ncbi:MAG TPA: arsenosugar biosynthesis radical SAM (seleno)protein ArsS [Terriglobales bacterium]|nr:arsenosugar biosynthesis radical SAM (seleno)protein ArsS [Terriglobales bacterium]